MIFVMQLQKGRNESKTLKYSALYAWSTTVAYRGISAVFHCYRIHIGPGDGIEWRSMAGAEKDQSDGL